MLFLLNYRREIESNTNDLGESERTAPEQIQGDAEMSDLEDQPVYQGPQTRSRTKMTTHLSLVTKKKLCVLWLINFSSYKQLAFIILSVM